MKPHPGLPDAARLLAARLGGHALATLAGLLRYCARAQGTVREGGEPAWAPQVDGEFRVLLEALEGESALREPRPGANGNGHTEAAEVLVVSEAGLARAKGYEAEECSHCRRMTLVRRGSCLCCESCGTTTGCG